MRARSLLKIAVITFAAAFIVGCGGGAVEETGYNEPPVQTTPAPIETPQPTYVPEPTAELEPELTWEHDFQRVVLQVGNPRKLVNNAWVDLDASPIFVDGELYTPIYGVEISGESIVAWDEQSQTMVITTGVSGLPQSVMYGQINGQREEWYGSPLSIQIANNLTMLQRHDGGWPRGIGQGGSAPHNPADIASITQEQLDQAFLSVNANDAYFGRGITANETRFMLRMYHATRIPQFRESGLRGLDAILRTQFTEGGAAGGWPYYVTQRTAHRGGASFNDDSMTAIMELLFDISNGEFPLLGHDLIAQSTTAFDKGLDAILNLQIRSSAFADGIERPTAWAQHYYQMSGLPMWAREFEPPAISTNEAVDIMIFLMELPNPCQRVIDAVNYAMYFLNYVEIHGYRHYIGPSPIDPAWGNNRGLFEHPYAGNLWARFVCVETFNPLFVDRLNPGWRTGEVTDAEGRHGVRMPYPGGILRNIYREDGTLDLMASYQNLSHERRNGYGYLGDWPRILTGMHNSWLRRITE